MSLTDDGLEGMENFEKLRQAIAELAEEASDIYSEKEVERIGKLAAECTDWAISKEMKELDQSDVELFLLDNKANLSRSGKKRLQMETNL